jgi:hypothetical protein
MKACRRTPHGCARLISEQQSSGKTQKDWCAEYGIRLRTFRDWVYRSKRGEFESVGVVDWVELNEGNVVLPDACHVSGEALEVSAGLYTVRVKPGFDRVMMSDIFRILAELC